MLDPVKPLLSALAQTLSAIDGLTVRTEWPGANEKLQYPTLTIFSQPAQFMKLPPHQVMISAPDENNQVLVTEVFGEYDFKMQLDLWCANKAQRSTVLGQVLDALTGASGEAQGLSLQLTDYFNEWARFDLSGHQYVDDEAAVQRQERRAKIDLLVNSRAVRQQKRYAMIKLQSTEDVTTTITVES